MICIHWIDAPNHLKTNILKHSTPTTDRQVDLLKWLFKTVFPSDDFNALFLWGLSSKSRYNYLVVFLGVAHQQRKFVLLLVVLSQCVSRYCCLAHDFSLKYDEVVQLIDAISFVSSTLLVYCIESSIFQAKLPVPLDVSIALELTFL